MCACVCVCVSVCVCVCVYAKMSINPYVLVSALASYEMEHHK